MPFHSTDTYNEAASLIWNNCGVRENVQVLEFAVTVEWEGFNINAAMKSAQRQFGLEPDERLS